MLGCPICDGLGYEIQRTEDGALKTECPCRQMKFCAVTAETQARAGMAQALANVRTGKEEQAVEYIYDQIRQLAELQPMAFTSDDLRKRCGEVIVELHTRNIIGALFKRAKAEGIIASTGQYVKSVMPQSHARPIMVWRKK